MASIITGIFTPKSPRLNNIAAGIDFASCVTLVVIGVLALLHAHGGIHIPPVGAGTMLTLGLGGIAILSYKKILADPKWFRNEKQALRYNYSSQPGYAQSSYSQRGQNPPVELFEEN